MEALGLNSWYALAAYAFMEIIKLLAKWIKSDKERFTILLDISGNLRQMAELFKENSEINKCTALLLNEMSEKINSGCKNASTCKTRKPFQDDSISTELPDDRIYEQPAPSIKARISKHPWV